MKKFFLSLGLFIFCLFLFNNLVLGRIGVGVGTGKIIITEKLKAGMSYNLPPFTVINVGDEASDYETAITYHDNQPELLPLGEWFEFSPKKFYLEPKEAQAIDITLSLPLKTIPGNYFAYVEGHPVRVIEGGAAINVAAAAKLYFTIAPANIFEGIYYKVLAFWKSNLPWTNVVAIIIGAVAIILIFRKFFKFKVSVGKK